MTVMHLESIKGLSVTYNLADIASVEIGKAMTYHSKADLAGNDMKPNDPIYYIRFVDGSISTLSADWVITYK